ncbi:MAG: GH36-type glycosyl hydrolase domain-containing protein [Candidatus Hodarchaeota archaeon]
MQYGYFDDERREYVINQPDTPLPWINYLGTKDYYSIISNTAGGFSFYKDPLLRRVTRYRHNNVPSDYGGRYLYLRNNNTNEFWSPSWQPTRHEIQNYECRHGQGYTIISSTFNNIEAQIKYFIPLDETLEIWQLSLKNHNKEKVNLSVFSCIEFALWDAMDDITNFQRNYNTGQVEVEENTIYHKTEYRERRNHFAFFACSEHIEGYDTERSSFLGPYRGWNNPTVVEKGKSNNSIASGWSPIGSHHILISLEGDDSCQIIFLLGYYENPLDEKFDPPMSQIINKTKVKQIISKYLQTKNIEKAFLDLVGYWVDLLGRLSVVTPDVHTNRMINIWNPYQNMVTFNLSRSVSFFESGITRGIGFRDSNQDILGIVHMIPERARERILDLAATQLKNGGAFHQFQPLTKRGNDKIGSNFNDDPLWLILSVAQYLKETGDWSILDELVDYENQPGTEETLEKHLERSLNYTLENLGPNNLPLIGRADWNDCLNLNCFSEKSGESFQTTTNKEGKIAESIFIAGMFVLAAKEYAEILRCRTNIKSSKYYLKKGKEMEFAVKKHGWDGEWFLRAYDAFGEKVGSQDCNEGKIFVEPQGFCIMAGIGIKEGLAEKALQSVNMHLATPHGILLLQPAYSRYYLNLGEISSYPPGYKENASIFCHTNPWMMIAEAMVGHGDQAFKYYNQINPSVREEISDIHRCEPYVYAQMIAGKDAPTYGEAKNSWLTGTAAWNFVAITQWILGIRPTYNGLQINPKIPKKWPSFTTKRHYRGVIYQITVERVGEGNSTQIWVDDAPLEGNIIPITNKAQVDVKVLIE